jgi:hypothetical protein
LKSKARQMLAVIAWAVVLLAGWEGFLAGQAVAPRAGDPRDGKRGWVQQVAADDIVTALPELEISTWGDRMYVGMPQAEAVRSAVLEIRTADQARRVACIEAPLRDAVGLFSTAFTQSLVTYPWRSAPSVPAGAYVAAWVINGERRSNVMWLTIDPQKDVAKLPRVRVVQAEPEKAGSLPKVMVYVTRAKKSDPAPNRVALAKGELVVDGMPILKLGLVFTGSNETLAVGETMYYPMSWESAGAGLDLTKPHKIAARVPKQALDFETGLGVSLEAFMESATEALEVGTPLGDAWDKATAGLAAAPAGVEVMSGEVVWERKAAARPGMEGDMPACAVTLTGEAGGKATVYTEVSDWEGRFSFRNVPEGVYTLVCHPRGGQFPRLSVRKVQVKEGAVAQVKVALTGGVELSGRVTRHDGSAAAEVEVYATWVSEDGLSELETAATTGADGMYVMRSAFGKCQRVAYLDDGREVRIDYGGKRLAEKEKADFQLLK